MTIVSPVQGFRHFVRRPERVLLLCNYDPRGTSTIVESIAYIQKLSRFEVVVLNMAEHRHPAENWLALRPQVDFGEYQALLFHNTACYFPENLEKLDRYTPVSLRAYDGAKILMKQDENHRREEIVAWIGATGFDLILTCLPSRDVAKVYPPRVVGHPRFERMLTGYITPTLRAFHPPDGSRPIDIGYRGSIQALDFGRLAYEKRKIGEDVAGLLDRTDLKLDISSRWQDRFGGDAWLAFLASCKATLGAESGASVFDLDGELTRRCILAREKLGPPREDSAYAEAFLAELADLENNVDYGQISPRHFEAATARTLQMLYPGRYSDILVPGRHFFALERDYSNLDAGIDLLRDERARARVTEAAYDEVVLNEVNWVEGFVSRLDVLLEEAMAAKNALRPSIMAPSAPRQALLLTSEDVNHDARSARMAAGARPGTAFHRLGLIDVARPEGLTSSAEEGFVWSVPRRSPGVGWLAHWYGRLSRSPSGAAALGEFQMLEALLGEPEERLCAALGAPDGHLEVAAFKGRLRHMLDGAAALLEAGAAVRGPAILVAASLPALLATLALAALHRVPVVFDAREPWPGPTRPLDFERQFWRDLQGRLAARSDAAQAPTAMAAAALAADAGLAVACVPDRARLDRARCGAGRPDKPQGECHVLVVGASADDPTIGSLLAVWPGLDARAVLLLSGADHASTPGLLAAVEAAGLRPGRARVLGPLSEDEWASAADEADIGVIVPSADGMGALSSHLVAAGLPLLVAGGTEAAEIVATSGCGYALDFADHGTVAQTVGALVGDAATRRALGEAAGRFFAREFHWEKAAGPFHRAVERLAGSDAGTKFEILVAPGQPASTAAPPNLTHDGLPEDRGRIDLLDETYGASLVCASDTLASTPCADVLLRKERGNDIAAFPPGLPVALEFDLGCPRAMDGALVVWAEREERDPPIVMLEAKLYPEAAWVAIVEGIECSGAGARFAFASRWTRYVRFTVAETDALRGVSLRALRVFACRDPAVVGPFRPIDRPRPAWL